GDQALRQPAHRAPDGRPHRRRRLRHHAARDQHGAGGRQAARLHVSHRQRTPHRGRGARASRVRADAAVRKRVKRRALLLAGGAWVATSAFSQTPKLRRIAFVSPSTQSGFQPYFAAFRSSLKEMGYVEGRDISLMARWNDDRTERLANLAAEVVASKPDAIVTASSAALAAF